MENDCAAHEALNSSSISLTPNRERKTMSPLVNVILVFLSVACGFLLILCIILAATRRQTVEYCNEINSPAGKTWLFAVAHHEVNIAYIDNRTGAISGYNVDVINAVCQIANTKCDIVWDIETNCWDSSVGKSPKGGPGLFSGWYDGCAGWIPTKARRRTFDFTTSYFKGPSEMLWIKKNATMEEERLPINIEGKKIGFLDGWHSDEFCLQEQRDIVGFDAEESSYIHYPSMMDLIEAVKNNEIDYAFCSSHPYLLNSLKSVTSSRICATEGPAIMHRKDSILSDWWNPSLEVLLTSAEYRDICMDLKRAHGHMPGGDPSRVCLDGWNSR